MFYENIYTALISFVGGFFFGIILDKLMYLIVVKIIHVDISLGFYISKDAILHTLLLFGILFFLIFLNTLRMVRFSNSIELLKGENIGEKEPKAKWLMALLGFLCLVGGYYIAVTVENPMTALSLFFIAVILVVAGTYLVFTAGSIALLKLLKKNKRYYYKTNHFISVSGVIYRMKQNAVGLANICILSTMVLVMISSTSSLMIGVEDILIERYPCQIEIHANNIDDDKFYGLQEEIDKIAGENDIKIEKQLVYKFLQFTAIYNDDEFIIDSEQDMSMLNDLCNLNFITAEDYSDYIGREVTLDDNEVIFYDNKTHYKNDSFILFGKTYTIIEHTDNYITNGFLGTDICPTYGIVVKDMSVINEIEKAQKEIYGKNLSQITSYIGIDTKNEPEAQMSFSKNIEKMQFIKNNNLKLQIDCREEQRSGTYGLYGGLFFIGIFLSLLFTMAAVLIIYYKQISEGYDDKKRFEIMQKVGMTAHEVKQSIHSQVLTVFFLPLITAGIHTAFAFPIIKKILTMMMLNNTTLYIICTIAGFACFAIIYGIIYYLTARVYYKIVKK